MLLELHMTIIVSSRVGAGLWVGCVRKQIVVTESTLNTRKSQAPDHSYNIMLLSLPFITDVLLCNMNSAK
jgi:hypothetical protein